MKTLSLREKSILAGLYFSKFDRDGLRRLGFDSFAEAFNVIGSALGVPSASIKNYRDEFDPLFPNGRRGWHKRAIRAYCKAIYDAFGGLSFENATDLVKQTIYKEHELDVLMEEVEKRRGERVTFAKRLITGQAAEQYFRSRYREVPLFRDCELEDTTRLGCGFDFRVSLPATFYGIEVKGLSGPNGNIALTDKEHAVASVLKGRFFLFVVKNFKETPFHELFQDPLNGSLKFSKIKQQLLQVSWTTRV